MTITVNDVGATTVKLSTGGSFSLARGGGVVQTTVPLTQGTDGFVITVTNEAGLTAQLSRTLVYDVTPPAGSVVFPAAGGYVRGTVDLSVDATDNLTGVSSVGFRIDGGSSVAGSAQSNPSNFTAALDTKTLADGSHTLVVTLTDGVGNSAQLTSTFVVDNTPPSVSVTSPAAGSVVNGAVDVTATASDATSGVSSIVLLVNGTAAGSCADATSCTVSFNTATLADGAFNVTAQAVDGAGNGATSAQVGATSVNHLPSQFITSPVAGAIVTGSSVTVAVNVSDPYFASVECLVNGTSLGVSSSATFSQSVSLSQMLDGATTVTCNVHDRAGNVGTQSVVFTLKRWSIELKPREIERRQCKGTVAMEVEGANLSTLLPIAGKGLSLVVPGGTPVAAQSGGYEGKSTTEVLLAFDRGAVVSAIGAGIAAGKINPKKPFPVSLYAGAHLIGSDLVSLDRDEE